MDPPPPSPLLLCDAGCLEEEEEGRTQTSAQTHKDWEEACVGFYPTGVSPKLFVPFEIFLKRYST